MENRNKLLIVGVLGALAVALGAFGAHSLKSFLSSGQITVDQLNGFDTGVRYQMYHTIAMLAVIILGNTVSSPHLNRAFFCFLTGIVLFSGSLYFLTTRTIIGADFLRVLGPVTPLGGLFFMAGWLFLAAAAFKKASK